MVATLVLNKLKMTGVVLMIGVKVAKNQNIACIMTSPSYQLAVGHGMMVAMIVSKMIQTTLICGDVAEKNVILTGKNNACKEIIIISLTLKI